MGLKARIYAAPGEDRRRATRVATDLGATLRGSDDDAIEAAVRDLSTEGFQAVTSATLPLGQIVRVGLSGLGVREARIRWHARNHYGFEFVAPLAPNAVALAQAADTVLEGPFGYLGAPAPSSKWPRNQRILFIAGSAASLWALMLAVLYR